MPPKSKKIDGQTEAERQITEEAQRLLRRAKPSLLQSKPCLEQISSTPAMLRRADGADIVKRNTTRKKRYLFVFPGALSIPPGATIGSLSGLDTRTPVLYIEFPPHGRLQLRGTLVFPKNSMIAIKGTKSANRPVQVVDTFETLVVFSEWAWVGDESSNPGALPQPLPEALKGMKESLWKSDADIQTVPANASEMEEMENSSADRDELLLDDSDGCDDDAWIGKKTDAKFSEDNNITPRSNPKRKRTVVNYAKLDDDDDDIEGSDEGSTADDGSKNNSKDKTMEKDAQLSSDTIDLEMSQPAEDLQPKRKRPKRVIVLSQTEEEDSVQIVEDIVNPKTPASTISKAVVSKVTPTSRGSSAKKFSRSRKPRKKPIDLDDLDNEGEDEEFDTLSQPGDTPASQRVQRKRKKIYYAADSGDEYEDGEDGDFLAGMGGDDGGGDMAMF